MRVGLAVLLLVAGCRSTGRGLQDSDLSFKAPAIKSAVASHDRSAVPQLVNDLDSDDAAVRFFAIQGLRRITGQDFGYHYYEDAPDRRPAVVRWQTWAKEHPP